MATRVVNAAGPDQNYANGADFLTNGVAGTAPGPGDTVVDNTSTSTGSITATNLAITSETIQVSNNAAFYTVGATSLDANSSITDLNQADTSNDLDLGTGFVNNGAITNANSIFVDANGTSGTPLITNNGTLLYTTAPTNASAGSNYEINGYNSTLAPEFINNGTITVASASGANDGSIGSSLTTYFQFYGAFAAGTTSVVNVVGSSPNTTGFATPSSGATQSVAEFVYAVSGSGAYDLNDGEIQFDSTSSGQVTFLDGSSIADLANVTNTASTLSFTGFRAGDAIGLGTTAITSAAYDATTGMIDLFNGTVMVDSLNIVATGSQNLATATYSIVPLSAVTPDQSGGGVTTSQSTRNQVYLETNLAAPCYCPGTLIRTDRGDVAVERLAIGDRVITLAGSAEPIRWIGRRAFAGRFIEGRRDVLPVCIHQGALGSGLPRRDLHVSPLHAMYLHGALVPAVELVNGVSVTQADAVDHVEYIHVELARHQVIWAEGAASESFVDDFSRTMFHNAHEFAGLYPQQAPAAAVYCAPRIEAGEALAAVKREIDQRAGLALPGLGATLRGRVDTLEGLVLSGWAQNPDQPEAPVCLDVLLDGVAVARTVANQFRPDLLAAGLGSGCHSFRVRLPAKAKQARIEVRRTSDGHALGVLDNRRRAAA